MNVNNTQEYAKKMVLLTNTSKKLLSNLVKENNKKLKEYEIEFIINKWKKILK